MSPRRFRRQRPLRPPARSLPDRCRRHLHRHIGRSGQSTRRPSGANHAPRGSRAAPRIPRPPCHRRRGPAQRHHPLRRRLARPRQIRPNHGPRHRPPLRPPRSISKPALRPQNVRCRRGLARIREIGRFSRPPPPSPSAPKNPRHHNSNFGYRRPRRRRPHAGIHPHPTRPRISTPPPNLPRKPRHHPRTLLVRPPHSRARSTPSTRRSPSPRQLNRTATGRERHHDRPSYWQPSTNHPPNPAANYSNSSAPTVSSPPPPSQLHLRYPAPP
jgi:hypothetical protein